ncbi:ead/Ea22-like family protein [Klebsiella variicola]|uniref:ead/Ea22-like family protein n=1 Tax=Klebsiella variicola TaxID=244366 RepID=UPI00058429EF|nr:RelE family toxin-antitoxin system [Klebsiella variicola]
MTDITELAQHMKAAAVLAKKYRNLTLTVSVDETLALVEALEYYKSREERVTSLVRDNSKSWDELYRQVEAKGKRNVELVEALESEKRICATWRKTAESTGEKLEKAQTINAAAEKLVRCKGRYHSEQNYRALAALFGVTTPDLPPLEHENVHYADAAEIEIAALRQRIAELEESNAQVIQSRDHYKRMTEEGLKQLAEARTVKLPDLRQIVSGDRYVWSDGVYNYSQDVKVALAAAGIKVEAE